MADISEKIKSLEASKKKAEESAPDWKVGQKRLEQIMMFMIVVLFVGFATTFLAAGAMLVDGWRSKQASYQQLELQVQAQNDKIEQLIQAQK